MDTRRWLLLAVIAAQGCGGYYAPDEVTFGTVIYTQAGPGVDFKPLRKFFLDPTADVFKDGTQQPSVAVPSSTVMLIASRMAAYGYTSVGTPDAADVGVRLTFFNNTVSYYYSYCSIYWSYYGCYPYWGYAGSYSTGSVAQQMLDLRTNPPPGGSRTVLWLSAAYAVKAGTSGDAVNNLNNGLNKIFDQSTFLKTSAVP